MANTKVFILEDENIVAKDIEQSLKKLGYDVVGVASSGEKVKELLKDGVKPEIFLMDIMIKGDMDGIEVDVANDFKFTDMEPVGRMDANLKLFDESLGEYLRLKKVRLK